mmetsp:Transcript_43592/g.126885  ORF Transcript_43592/g.126885 Transcript_43592/m.126885 type:complete len:93 (-) Transcript_43592:35-313(-)
MDVSWQQRLMRERHARQSELNAEISRRETAELHQREIEEELVRLLSENRLLQSEVEGGKLIIEQFAGLMAEKADHVCQYCRRSGTLKPPSIR